MRAIGVTLIVGIWWVTEALPLGATALVPAALFPILGIATAKEIAPSYASSFILLLLGGFLLALAVERSGVHRRIALHVLLLIGTSPRRLVLGFAVATGALSMWISNTASTLIMMPIVLAIADRANRIGGDGAKRFSLAVLLGTGYGASIGGMGTPIGTPPNVIAMGALENAFPDGPTLTFLDWALVAIPLVAVLIPIMWLLITRVVLRVPNTLDLGAEPVIREELVALGAMRAIEKRSLMVFGLAAALWMTRSGFTFGDGLAIPGWAALLGLGKAPDDGTVAMFAAVVAFMLPSGEPDESRLLPWSVAVKAPWDLVLLFGGGIALSKGFTATGLSTYLGGQLATLGDSAMIVFVGGSALAATFGTEIISNTALANISMPILAETAKNVGMDPRALLVPCALACSCAFMMPAATGPNAIVFGTGRVRIGEMVRVGFVVNWVAWAVIVVVGAIVYG